MCRLHRKARAARRPRVLWERGRPIGLLLGSRRALGFLQPGPSSRASYEYNASDTTTSMTPLQFKEELEELGSVRLNGNRSVKAAGQVRLKAQGAAQAASRCAAAFQFQGKS